VSTGHELQMTPTDRQTASQWAGSRRLAPNWSYAPASDERREGGDLAGGFLGKCSGSKHRLGLECAAGKSVRVGKKAGALLRLVACSVEDGLGVVSGFSDAEGLFRRRPTQSPSMDRDTELVEHIHHRWWLLSSILRIGFFFWRGGWEERESTALLHIITVVFVSRWVESNKGARQESWLPVQPWKQ
jgi:hypothetical protein